MKMRDDLDPAQTWVTADSHFGHDNIVGFCLRPDDHEQAMIAEWRAEVPENATLLHLGDLVYRSNGFFKNVIAKELTGERKLLILGNHDRQRYSFYRDAGFKIVRPFGIMYRTWRVSFSHYPWSASDPEPWTPHDIRIHGHIHNNGYTRAAYVPYRRGHINVSVEMTHYRPVNLQVLLESYLNINGAEELE